MKKCKACGSSWDTKQIIDRCPFCGADLEEKITVDSIESAFKVILERHGQNVFYSNILLGLLGDYAPSLIKERNLVKIAIESGAYRAICMASIEEREHVINKYISLLTESYFIDEVWARRALMWCAGALDIEPNIGMRNGREKANQIEDIRKGIVEDYLSATFDALEFSVKNNECFVKSLRDKKSTEIEIPEKYQGKPVTAIGDDAFNGCEKLTSVMIPSSVSTIGDGAFMKCESLTDITIPDSVKTIGASAFFDCKSLISVVIPSSVKTIGASAFNGCESLSSVMIPSSETTIGEAAFFRCRSLSDQNGFVIIRGVLHSYCHSGEHVTIPSSVKTIGALAFSGCESLMSVTIPPSVEIIGGMAFDGCKSLTSVMIPSSVKTIEAFAFEKCESLTSVTISDGVITIGEGAFRDCESLTRVMMPSSVKTIGDDVFGGCTNLLSISGGSATGIDTTKSTIIYAPMNGKAVKLADVPDAVFASGMLGTGVAIEPIEGKLYAPFDGIVTGVFDTEHAYTLVNHVGVEMLIHIGLDTVELGGKYFTSRVMDGQRVRKGELLAEFNLNAIKKEYRMITPILLMNAEEYSAVEIIKDSGPVKVGDVLYAVSNVSYPPLTPDDAFAFSLKDNGYSVKSLCDKKYSEIKIPEKYQGEPVTAIGMQAFRECKNLTSVTIPSSVTTIGPLAFEGCTSLVSVVIPSSVSYIGFSAFSGCKSLTSVTIPSSVRFIGASAFRECESLTSVTIPSSFLYFGGEVFDLCPKLKKLSCFGDSDTEIQMPLWEFFQKMGQCSYCGGPFKKGLFSTKCMCCGRKKNY